MGVAVGQTKPDVAASYGNLHAGPLHGWGSAPRSIRVDAFDLDYKTGGVDRGPTPTVSVLDATGNVIKTQRVYPNMTLKTGSLTVYPSDYGLSANISLLDAAGSVTGRSTQLIDFSGNATEGTVPTGLVTVTDRAGNALLGISLTVPLDRVNGELRGRIPTNPRARVVVTSADNTVSLDQIVTPGQDLALPDGSQLRLDSLGYYARLQVVNDGSIPLLYSGLIVAVLGLTIAVVARQQIVLGSVIDGPDGSKLVMKLRLWRNTPSSRSEIESELTRALGGAEKENTE
jgi:cytochrome c biogenesis protein ResB